MMYLGSALVDELGDIVCRLIEGLKWHSHRHHALIGVTPRLFFDVFEAIRMCLNTCGRH